LHLGVIGRCVVGQRQAVRMKQPRLRAQMVQDALRLKQG
jgi:hypothetical protein